MAKNTMLETFQKAREAYVAARDAITSKMIADALGEVVPEGKILVWSQYTPYFNDGEACEFGVNEAHIQDDNGFENLDSPYDGTYVSKKNFPELAEVWSQLSNDETLMLHAFGDHTCVAVKRGGEYHTREYSHD